MSVVRKLFGSVSVTFGAPLDVRQYADATVARAEKEQEISVPTSATIDDLGYAIMDALIGNATCAMPHVTATILLANCLEATKPELVRRADRLGL